VFPDLGQVTCANFVRGLNKWRDLDWAHFLALKLNCQRKTKRRYKYLQKERFHDDVLIASIFLLSFVQLFDLTTSAPGQSVLNDTDPAYLFSTLNISEYIFKMNTVVCFESIFFLRIWKVLNFEVCWLSEYVLGYDMRWNWYARIKAFLEYKDTQRIHWFTCYFWAFSCLSGVL